MEHPVRQLLLPLIVIASAGAASAEVPEPMLKKLAADGRYQLLEINDRVLRLDTAQGVFDQCVLDANLQDWRCTPTEDMSKALKDQVEGLTKRIEVLEAEIAASRAEREKGLVGRITDYVPGWP